MDSKKTRQMLFALLIVNVVSTSLHYIDNFINYDNYPQPNWITPDSIYLAWIVLTMFGIVGYLFYVKNALWIAYFCLGIYSITVELTH